LHLQAVMTRPELSVAVRDGRLVVEVDADLTTARILRAIAVRQRDFFERGVDHLAALALDEIAGDLGVHKTTVWRVVCDKRVSTPHGTFSMRFFFDSGPGSRAGHRLGSRALKTRIHRLVLAEPPGHPFSDHHIAAILRSRGIAIARTTVAKYRRQLGIPSTRERRWARRPVEILT
jgi:RNA polymerase sigma-54 factor